MPGAVCPDSHGFVFSLYSRLALAASIRCFLGDGKCGLTNVTVEPAALRQTIPILPLLTPTATCPDILLQTQPHDRLPDCNHRFTNVTDVPGVVLASEKYVQDTTVSTWCNDIWSQNFTGTIRWQCTLPCARRFNDFAAGCTHTLFQQQHAAAAAKARQGMAKILDQVRATQQPCHH